ncbi:hypothetical protein BKA67DRAFT_660495 [Truncatella angustata]|jgi:hypothetical protein|uniref:Uncharacterized protein n=1 Tax=Truncatella angustata TaxID=152316 RepID=A0A9P8ZUD8_9PEZI|nr:uncharacterized protein BKA67DRAFT_660495 [Truncatella angustata]KAH6651704.1 hypothetical protein BKA67DRAFT_660495 [Truncatella angustata]KAH8198085.1 hypothetical protein TruAng_007757 [Truncatella angustata]
MTLLKTNSPVVPPPPHTQPSGGGAGGELNTVKFEVKYTLSETELDALSARLLSEQPPKVRDALVLYRLEGTDELSNLGRHIERQVFLERFGNTDADMRRVYGDYEAASDFFIAMDRSICRPVGTMRNIKNSSAGLLALRDTGTYTGITVEQFKQAHNIKSLDTVWDIGTLAIPEQYRDRDEHHIVAMLYRGAHVRGCYEGMTHYIAMVDKLLYRTFKMIGFAFHPMAGLKPFSYEGSDSIQPVCGVTEDFFPTVEAKLRSADERLKPILQYFAKRFIHGHDVDHRLMYDYAVWSGGSTPVKKACSRAVAQARL